MTASQKYIKRTLDLILAAIGLLIASPLLLLGVVVAHLSTKESGFYRSTRIGQHGTPFTMWKIRTMRTIPTTISTVTTRNDPRITKAGHFLRKTKLDELPQLWNVLIGDMSLVGPRPDVPGFADTLQGDDRIILTSRPGITGLATLAFRHEEALLALQKDPEAYNKTVLWPEKVRLNKKYSKEYSLSLDVKILFKTILAL